MATLCTALVITSPVASTLESSVVESMSAKTIKIALPALDNFVDILPVVDGDALYGAGHHVSGCQYAGEQRRREHEREDNQDHLRAPPGDVARPDFEKDAVRQREQPDPAENDQRDNEQHGHQCVEWEAK